MVTIADPIRLRRVLPPPAAAWIALWIVVIAGEVLALWPVLFDRDAPIEGVEVALALVGGSFAACGLIAWRRRPDSRVGMLMTSTGFCSTCGRCSPSWAANSRRRSANAGAEPVALSLRRAAALVPLGRPAESRLDRLLVAAFAIPMALGQLLWMLFDPVEGHLLLAWPDADVAWTIDRVQRALLGLPVRGHGRGRRARLPATPPRRRALLPSLAGAFTLLMFTVLAVDGLIGGTSSTRGALDGRLLVRACPLAFLAGLLRSRLARGGLADLLRGLGTMSAADMEPALRRALGDPGLVLALAARPAGTPGRP